MKSASEQRSIAERILSKIEDKERYERRLQAAKAALGRHEDDTEAASEIKHAAERIKELHGRIKELAREL